jgi:hypothetical protein
MGQIGTVEKFDSSHKLFQAVCSRRTVLLFIFVVALTALVAIREISVLLTHHVHVTMSSSGANNNNPSNKNHLIRGAITSNTVLPSINVVSPEQVRLQLEAMGLTPIYDPVTTTDPWRAELFQRLDRIRAACGELCQMNTVEAVQEHTIPVPGSAIPMLQVKSVDCPAILGLEEIDAGDTTAPPTQTN